MFAFVLSFFLAFFGAFHPAPPKGVVALKNATIYTVKNGVIPSGTVLIKDGKITAVGANVTVPNDAQVIDCTGKSIYPGLIDGGSQIGLHEIGSIAETQDENELGNITPQMQALTAVNPNSVVIPITRVNGVTTGLAMPTGGLFPGTAALINLYGYTPQQMYTGFKGVVLNFPSTGRFGGFDRRSDEDIEKASKKAMEELNQTWQKALDFVRIQAAYNASTATHLPEYAPEMEALAPVVKKEMPLLVEVNAAKDILAALDWIKAKGMKAILTGCAEGWRVADKIAASQLPCVVGPILSMPTRDSDRYDRAYGNAGLLHKAGVKIAIRSEDSDNGNVRNLPYHAGYAAAFGLGKDEALRAVTLDAAEIFGVADHLGSIEVGKDATLFVTTGDPFEPKTQVLQIFIDGYNVPVISRHTELYKEFLQRNPGLNK
jgi:imidazolonepropionase-like amidohydrolase